MVLARTCVRRVYQTKAEAALADALEAAVPAGDDGTARLAAYQIFAVQRALTDDNRRHLTAGTSADVRYPQAVAAADRGFAMLRHGLTDRYG